MSQDDIVPQVDVILLAIEMLKEGQKGDTDWQSLAKSMNATAAPTGE